jgi:RNA polymerase sigma factor (sigma-70 family)
MIIAYNLKGQIYQLILVVMARLYAGFFLMFCNSETQVITEPRENCNAKNKSQINMQAERLLAEYGNGLLRLAYSYMHNMSDAEDVLQDTMIQFIRKAPSFESKSHEKAWIMRVAINISKNKIQYNKQRYTDELSENLAADENKDLSFVWEAVKELPVLYREVIHLFYHEGFSTAQIAKILDKNETTVRSLLHRGRLRLKDTLKEVYDFEE